MANLKTLFRHVGSAARPTEDDVGASVPAAAAPPADANGVARSPAGPATCRLSTFAFSELPEPSTAGITRRTARSQPVAVEVTPKALVIALREHEPEQLVDSLYDWTTTNQASVRPDVNISTAQDNSVEHGIETEIDRSEPSRPAADNGFIWQTSPRIQLPDEELTSNAHYQPARVTTHGRAGRFTGVSTAFSCVMIAAVAGILMIVDVPNMSAARLSPNTTEADVPAPLLIGATPSTSQPETTDSLRKWNIAIANLATAAGPAAQLAPSPQLSIPLPSQIQRADGSTPNALPQEPILLRKPVPAATRRTARLIKHQSASPDLSLPPEVTKNANVAARADAPGTAAGDQATGPAPAALPWLATTSAAPNAAPAHVSAAVETFVSPAKTVKRTIDRKSAGHAAAVRPDRNRRVGQVKIAELPQSLPTHFLPTQFSPPQFSPTQAKPSGLGLAGEAQERKPDPAAGNDYMWVFGFKVLHAQPAWAPSALVRN